MLTIWEMRLNFIYFKYMSKIKFLPFFVDAGQGKMYIVPRSDTTCWRLWTTYFTIGMLHLLYLIVRLIQTVMYPQQYFHLLRFPFHVVSVIIYSMSLFWAFFPFIMTPEIFVALFNTIFEDDEFHGKIVEDGEPAQAPPAEGEVIVVEASGSGSGSGSGAVVVPSNLDIIQVETAERGQNKEGKVGVKAVNLPLPRVPTKLNLPPVVINTKSKPVKTIDDSPRSQLEIYITYFPILAMAIISSFAALQVYEPQFNNLVCSVFISPENKRPWYLPFFILYECFMACFLTTSLTPGILVMLFMEQNVCKVQDSMDALKKESVDTTPTIELCYKLEIAYEECRQMQLSVQLFSEGFGQPLNLAKNQYIIITVVMITFAIRVMQHDDGDIFYALFYFFVGINFAGGWIVCFDKASHLPRNVASFKKVIRFLASQLAHRGSLKGKEIKRAVASVTSCKSKYNIMSRTATPTFLRKASRHILKLLIALGRLR